MEEEQNDAETGRVREAEKTQDQDRMDGEQQNDAETDPVPEAEKKHPKHPRKWIDRLLKKYKKDGLQMSEHDSEIYLWCNICYTFYLG